MWAFSKFVGLGLYPFLLFPCLGLPVAQVAPHGAGGRCVVAERFACGVRGISKADCEAKSCCFDGNFCYYGNVDRHSASREMVIVSSNAIVLTAPDVPVLTGVDIKNKGSVQELEAVKVTSDANKAEQELESAGTIPSSQTFLGSSKAMILAEDSEIKEDTEASTFVYGLMVAAPVVVLVALVLAFISLRRRKI